MGGRASEVSHFPYRSQKVPFILVKDGVTLWENTITGKRRLLAEADGLTLLAPWPGEWRTDVFVVDDVDKAELELLSDKQRLLAGQVIRGESVYKYDLHYKTIELLERMGVMGEDGP